MQIKPIYMWEFFSTSQDTRLTGFLMNGDSVITTDIAHIRGRFAQTRNSIYFLEEANPLYLSSLGLSIDCDDIKMIYEAIENPKFILL